MKKLLYYTSACLFFFGCANPEYKKMQEEAVFKAKDVSITCKEQQECASKWAKALLWVTNNSVFKLRIANESIIVTEGPIDDFVYSTDSAFAINKIPNGSGGATFIFKSYCANRFGCHPTKEIHLVNFADFVNSN